MIQSSEKNFLYTIGHSTRSLEDFLTLLQTFHIQELVDIRTIPQSSHNPQYNKDTFPDFLEKYNINYVHMKDLGGLRHAKKDSINTGWKNASFRGFADYMQSSEFHQAIETLISHIENTNVVTMCAEAVPWRCHRSLIADALLVRGFMVKHIISATNCKEHKLTSFAHVDGKTIIYQT